MEKQKMMEKHTVSKTANVVLYVQNNQEKVAKFKKK